MLINMRVKAFAGGMAESSRPLGRQRHFIGFVCLTLSNVLREFSDGGRIRLCRFLVGRQKFRLRGTWSLLAGSLSHRNKVGLPKAKDTSPSVEDVTVGREGSFRGSAKIAQGEDVLNVSAQLGHAKPSITYDVYLHDLRKRRPAAAAQTDEMLFGKRAAAD